MMTDQNNKPDLSALKIDRSKKYDDRPKSKLWKYLLLILFICIIVAAYFGFKEKITPATKVKAATATVISGSEAQAALVATGYVVAQRKAEVASKGTGRLKFLGFEEGDEVRANEIIAELDNDDIKAYLEAAKADLLRAEADYHNNLRQYNRKKELLQTRSISETEFEFAETDFELSKATVAGAKARLTASEVDLENTYIRAPFDGTVLTKNADVGEIVAPFASSASSKGSVVTLADMNSLVIEADVSESNINKVKIGQPCEIILDAYSESPYPGYVKKIVPTADRARATVLTKIAFNEIDKKVLPEMSARVNFFFDDKELKEIAVKKTIGIKKDAITNRDGRTVVFIIKDNYIEMKNVKTGRELGETTEILSGLSDGDKVVLSPPGKMKNGDKVEITF